ncbi:MAG: hypothetical protein ACO3C1_09925 [Ilumatobacteraceae bacterium]
MRIHTLPARLASMSLVALVVGGLAACGDAARSGTVVALQPVVQCLSGGVSSVDEAPIDAKKVVLTWTAPTGATKFEFTKFTGGSHLETPTPLGATRVDVVALDRAGKQLTSAGATCTTPTTEPPLPVATDAPITVGGSPDTTKP